MPLKVQYLRGVKSTAPECWSFVAVEDDVASAMSEARDVQDAAQHYWGAKSYRILDEDGRVLSAERIVLAEPLAN